MSRLRCATLPQDGSGRGGGGLFVRKALFPRPHGAVLLVTVTHTRSSRTSPFASSCEICGHSSAKSMFSCILVTQLIEDLMQQSRKLGVRLLSGDVQNLRMPPLTGTFWTFAGSVHTYFVPSVSSEVRATSARWDGSRWGEGWGLFVRKPLFPGPHYAVLLATVTEIVLPETPR